MSNRVCLAVALVFALGSVANAGVWTRTRPDGTVEYTNVSPGGKDWKHVEQTGTRPTPPRRAAVRTGRPASVVWTRQNDDGSIEFTNLRPLGARWKVLFKTGPGKASALRGRSDVVAPRDTSLARFRRYDEHIRDQQLVYGVPQALIRAVIKTESDFDPQVVSSAGAQGLMQLMPDTAKDMGVTDVWDPRQNIMGGARYLQLLAKRFCKTPGVGAAGITSDRVCSFEEKVKVLAGYHAGPGAVEKYRGMPPYETTRSYVTMVLRRYEEFRRREATMDDLRVMGAPGPEGPRAVAEK